MTKMRRTTTQAAASTFEEEEEEVNRKIGKDTYCVFFLFLFVTVDMGRWVDRLVDTEANASRSRVVRVF